MLHPRRASSHHPISCCLDGAGNSDADPGTCNLVKERKRWRKHFNRAISMYKPGLKKRQWWRRQRSTYLCKWNRIRRMCPFRPFHFPPSALSPHSTVNASTQLHKHSPAAAVDAPLARACGRLAPLQQGGGCDGCKGDIDRGMKERR